MLDGKTGSTNVRKLRAEMVDQKNQVAAMLTGGTSRCLLRCSCSSGLVVVRAYKYGDKCMHVHRQGCTWLYAIPPGVASVGYGSRAVVCM